MHKITLVLVIDFLCYVFCIGNIIAINSPIILYDMIIFCNILIFLGRVMYNNNLSPLFKWTGGKRKEIKIFKDFFPDFVKNNDKYTFVEPFAGGAAVYWYLNNIQGENIINDYDTELINFYKVMSKQPEDFIEYIRKSSSLYQGGDTDHDKQSKNYYHWRNLDRNNGLETLSEEERAARFWIVNQLSFSGMRRFNKKGEFNVPYGHYKNLNSNLITSHDHVELLNNTSIENKDYMDILDCNDHYRTFIFLDPPYTRVMKKYSSDNEFTEKDQENLRNKLISMDKASWMLVIDQSELTEELYKGYISNIYNLKYGINIRNRFDTGVNHLIVSNYLPHVK